MLKKIDIKKCTPSQETEYTSAKKQCEKLTACGATYWCANEKTGRKYFVPLRAPCTYTEPEEVK